MPVKSTALGNPKANGMPSGIESLRNGNKVIKLVEHEVRNLSKLTD
jgi:hypothetical protein